MTTAPQALAAADASAPPKTSGFRPDIQGLRAVAVVAVILDHLLKWPAGGFVGVDVFFVISGFLVTGLLLREHDRYGRISFVGFYRRRVKRILPAALLVLVATVIASFLIFNPSRATSISFDALWAAAFSANWNFAAAGTDYFQAGNAISPLQHFWSLAVEEQFYFVWPWLMAAIFIGVRRRSKFRNDGHRVVGVAMTAIVVMSFAWSLWETATNPGWAYFSTLSRAWELGVGALLAVGAPLLARIPPRGRTYLAWGGLVAIVLSVFVVPAEHFPAPWAVLPVLATGAVIAAGTGQSRGGPWPLTNPVSRYVGEISYSLYLWHFPVIILGGVLLGQGTWNFIAASVIFTALLAIGSFHFVEDPLRRYSPGRRAHRKKWSPATAAKRSRRRSLTLLAVSAGLCLAAVTLLVTKPAVSSSSVLRVSSAVEDVAIDDSTDLEAANNAALKAALSASAWPDLTPPLAELGRNAFVPEWRDDRCLDVMEEDLDRCVYGSREADRTAVLLGDSTAISYMPALQSALPGWKIQPITMGQCPVADVAVRQFAGTGEGRPFPECAQHRKWSMDMVAAIEPDLVIATDAFNTSGRLDGGSAADYRAGLESSVVRLASIAKAVAVVPSAPGLARPVEECRTNLSRPADCFGEVSEAYRSYARAQDAAVQAAAAENAVWIPTVEWFCLDSLCPAFVDGSYEYADNLHLTQPASSRLGPLLAEALKPLLDSTAGR